MSNPNVLSKEQLVKIAVDNGIFTLTEARREEKGRLIQALEQAGLLGGGGLRYGEMESDSLMATREWSPEVTERLRGNLPQTIIRNPSPGRGQSPPRSVSPRRLSPSVNPSGVNFRPMGLLCDENGCDPRGLPRRSPSLTKRTRSPRRATMLPTKMAGRHEEPKGAVWCNQTTCGVNYPEDVRRTVLGPQIGKQEDMAHDDGNWGGQSQFAGGRSRGGRYGRR